MHSQHSLFVYDKITEETYHFKLGRRLAEKTTVFIDLPYVVRNSLEVDDHAILGSRQRADGLGGVHQEMDFEWTAGG